MISDKVTAIKKIENWCAYQERSQQEVRDKLYKWQLKSNEVEEIIAELISNNFLNQERFAKAYVSGKFNIKKWGRLKIKQGLQFKKVPEKLIQIVLSEIDADKYFETICRLAEKKEALMKEKDPFKKKLKLEAYLQNKGFEKDLIILALKNNRLKI